MKCPHCVSDCEAAVVETRDHGGCVYRRRRCGLCLGGYVTVEAGPAGMVMPPPQAHPDEELRAWARLEHGAIGS